VHRALASDSARHALGNLHGLRVGVVPADQNTSELDNGHIHMDMDMDKSERSGMTLPWPLAIPTHHLLSLPFIMASREPMPRYFFTFTPFCSK
jgi:hypothetical protein